MFGEHSKIDTAIARLKNFEEYALQLDPEGYYVCDSGGKDSSVIKQLCIEAGVKFAVYHHHTTVDHPETVYFVRQEQKRFRDMGYNFTIDYSYNKSGKRITMWDLIESKGFPTRIRRFCCEVLKERGGWDRCVVTGVRWSESVRRKNQRGIYEAWTPHLGEETILSTDNDNARQIIESCIKKVKTTVNPIVDWEDEDVWEYIKLRNIPYNPLYDQGYKRIGCIGCPMNSGNAMELEKNPKYKQMYIHAAGRYLKKHPDKIKEYGWTAEDWYKWWLGQKPSTKGNFTMFDEDQEEEDEIL